jgi:hypothetical protein
MHLDVMTYSRLFKSEEFTCEFLEEISIKFHFTFTSFPVGVDVFVGVVKLRFCLSVLKIQAK